MDESGRCPPSLFPLVQTSLTRSVHLYGNKDHPFMVVGERGYKQEAGVAGSALASDRVPGGGAGGEV